MRHCRGGRTSHSGNLYGQRHPSNAFKGGECHARCATTNSNSSIIHLSLMPRSSPASSDGVQVTEASASHPPVAGGTEAVAAPRCRNTSFRPPLSEPESVKQRPRAVFRRKTLRCAFRGGRMAPGNVAGMSHLSRVNAPLRSKYAVVGWWR